MYWSIHQYPSLAGRPRAERQDVVRAALKQNRSSFGFRLLVVFAAVVAGAIAGGSKLAPAARLTDFRTWIAPAAGAALHLRLPPRRDKRLHPHGREEVPRQ